ncbi:hypothetical protein [Paramaledivibacter caminithermalis]|uniref:Uncharacterized protein n=1 Tax=Paramaledivibacter caminithermalis (strain DSM 15212 / CIP 107654 / DViRD3) TaxID=1121301 RepID=A0A1M6LYA4_PARC5|nr:hypothetical protein [Paramaledivibacter caminithermalis]SHJ76023.1 hypothetical protein SAMN02745912_00969 [Paramaledivibacter caminithermalis DSM 15212]
MNCYYNPYAIDRIKEKEKVQNERIEKMENAIGEIVRELKNIGERLEKIEKKIQG